ncbi:NAD-binding protein [Myxococcota bacterium]
MARISISNRSSPRTTTDQADVSKSRTKSSTKEKKAPKKSPTKPVKDESTVPGQGLDPFISYYKQWQGKPKTKTTVQTLNQDQLGVLHDLYWQVPSEVTLQGLCDLAGADEAFENREPPGEEQLRTLFQKREMKSKHFPWAWRERAFTLASYELVDALLTTARRTSLETILGRLGKDRKFPPRGSFRDAACEKWVTQELRYPFVKRLPFVDGSYQLKAQAPAQALQYDTRGRLLVTGKLADVVEQLSEDERFKYDWNLDRFIDLVNEEIGGGGFNPNHMTRLEQHPEYGKRISTFTEMRAGAPLERLCQLITDLHASGIEKLNDVLDIVHEKHGYKRFHNSEVSFFRSRYYVPDFRQTKIDKRKCDALALARAIKANKGAPYYKVGKSLGHSALDLRRLFHALHLYYPEELPVKAQKHYNAEEIAILQKLADEAPLGATIADLFAVLQREQPEFFLRHDLTAPVSLSAAFRTRLGIKHWGEHQARRYREAFIDLVDRSPPDTTVSELARHMAEEHPDSYCPGWVSQLVREWKERPEDYPPIADLLVDGEFPWERARMRYSVELAELVAAQINKNKEKPLAYHVGQLRRRKGFKPKYPSFNVEHIHGLRVRFPGKVPWVDELTIAGRAERLRVQAEALKKLAVRAAKKAKTLDSSTLSIAELARQMNVKAQRLRNAIGRFHSMFPWVRRQPRCSHDLYLAHRVGYEMERAPVGMRLPEIVDELHRDPAFHAAYPTFTANSVQHLRANYPDYVPHWGVRNHVLRSKLIVDAILTAEKGIPYAETIGRLRDEYRGGFGDAYDNPDYVTQAWLDNPERFEFTRVLLAEKTGEYDLTGREGQLPPADETPSELAVRLARAEQIPKTLPLLERLADKLPSTTFDRCEAIVVQHLLDSQVATMDVYRRVGIKPSRTSIVGVPYSVSEPVVDALRDRGWNVRAPPVDRQLWMDDLREAMLERLESARKTGRRIVVFDDGGLVSRILATDDEFKEHAHRFRVVEMTRRGITVADGVDKRACVINVGQSWGKYVFDTSMANVSFTERLLTRVGRLGIESLKGKRIGVVGGGTTGLPFARELQAAGAQVTVLEKSKAARDKLEGEFEVADPDDPESTASFFGGQEIIMGSTGQESIKAEHFDLMPDNCVIGSTSSKAIEIDVEALSKRAVESRIVDDESHPPTVEYTMADGRRIRLLAAGYPINFDGGPEDVPPEEVQILRALMLIGGVQASGTRAAGIHLLNPKNQIGILEDLLELEGRGMRRPVRSAVDVAVEQLKKGSDRRHIAES